MADNENIKSVAALIYGASLPNTPQEAMIRVGSTPYNRAANFNKDPNFGSTVQEALQMPGAYYEFSGGNKKVEALKQGKILDENLYKRALAVAYGLEMGTIEKTKDQFFHTPAERARQAKKKSFNYDLVDINANIKNGAKGKGNDSWDFMSYKEPKKKTPKK
uniref:Uncharacterized protein n=1 Tax=viral metagenome TaxID=1070528 RepID=A0A6M3IPA2_9ZZZZ